MSTDARRPTILVVDDDDGMRLLLAIVGSACGYEVVTAASAEDAIRVLRRRDDVAALVSDFSMAGLSGLELLRWSKRDAPSRPVVLTSGLFPAGVEAEAHAAGAAAVLEKRVVVERLASVLDSELQPVAA